MILYHGTTKVFPRFVPGSFFTDSFDIAGAYAAFKSDSSYRGDPPRVLQCRVTLGKVERVTAPELAEAMGTYVEEDGTIRYIEWEEADEFLKKYQRMRRADTLILSGVRDLAPEESRVYDQYIVRAPDQIEIVNEVRGSTTPGEPTTFQPYTEEVYQ